MKVIESDDPRVEESFAALYRSAYGRIVRFAARRVGTGADAEDVAAEVFRIAWTRTCEGVDVTIGWLFVTAENVLRNHTRSQVRAQRLTTAVAGSTQPTSPDDDVLDALDRVDESTRRLLTLRYWDELSGAEIASVLGISMSAVWVRLHRARRAFREIYQEDHS